MGRLFGQPAAFVGVRPFARLTRRGLEYRTAPPNARGRSAAWVVVRPRTGSGYLRVAHQLELAILRAATQTPASGG
jgi:hypothetical protein